MMTVKHISDILSPMMSRIDATEGLYKEIEEAFLDLCARNPKSKLLPLVVFERGFPDPSPAFEKKYSRLIKLDGTCIYLEAHRQYLKDINEEIAKTY